MSHVCHRRPRLSAASPTGLLLLGAILMAMAPPVAAQETRTKLTDLPDSSKPITYTSAEGQFTVTFPTGCAKLHTKLNAAADGSDDVDVRVVYTICERADAVEEGCRVNARLGAAATLTDREAVTFVEQEIANLYRAYNVEPMRRTPVRRDYGDQGVVQGVDVQAQASSGGGDVRIYGLIRGADIYILVAWKKAGGLFADPQYQLFFDSFRPWVD